MWKGNKEVKKKRGTDGRRMGHRSSEDSGTHHFLNDGLWLGSLQLLLHLLFH